jgi:hypothetical protein
MEVSMFEIGCVISYHKPDGSKAKDGETRSWADLSKQDVHEFETAFNRAMTKMSKLAQDKAKGKVKWLMTKTAPCEMRMDIVINEDGVKWMRSTYEWPNMGEEAQAMLLGMIDGELSTLPDELRGAIRRPGKKK